MLAGGSYEAYLKSMASDGTWGDHVTLQVQHREAQLSWVLLVDFIARLAAKMN